MNKIMKHIKFKLLIFSLVSALSVQFCHSAVPLKHPDPKFFQAIYPGEDRTTSGILSNAKYHEESDEAALWAVHNYKELTANDCRPPVRMGDNGQVEVLFGVIIGDRFGQIACMLAGHKNVAEGSPEDFAQIPEDIKRQMDLASIKSMTFISRGEKRESIVLYTPKGKKQADLFVEYTKNFNPGKMNYYLFGRLMDYPERDIEAFYLRQNGKTQKTGESLIDFQNDKKAALEMLEKNQVHPAQE